MSSTIAKINTYQAASRAPLGDAAELIIEYLEQLGVGYIFGVPGGAVEPVYNALAKSARSGGLQAVSACHESAAASMADGYQRESGKIGVCIATSGPGATNLITGVACAYDNNIPMLVITGQPAITQFGRGALQESACTGVNIIGMFRHCTRYNTLVSHVNQLETKLTQALLRAHQHPQGPVHLSIPVDILRSVVASKRLGANLKMQIEALGQQTDERAIEQLADALKPQALSVESALPTEHSPLFLIGKGCNDAIEDILEVASLCGAKFVTTPDAKGLLNVRHSGYRGVFGLGGHVSAALTLRYHTSTIVAFGTDFGEFTSAGWCDSLMNNELIHVDSNPENILQTPMAKLHVFGSIKLICRGILARIKPSCENIKGSADKLHTGLNPNVVLDDIDKYYSDSVPIKPQRLMRELSEKFPRSTRFVVDAGNSMMWAPHYLTRNCSRRLDNCLARQGRSSQDGRSKVDNWLRVTMNFAPMGWAIGAAVGIARANPKCPVVCITGDGSYLMSGQEITVAAREGLSVIYVILNDSVYGMVMHGQRLAKAEPIAFDLPKVNFAELAHSLGVESHIIQSPEQFDELDIDKIIHRAGPTLLDVRIDREEVPPMIARLQTLGSVDSSLSSPIKGRIEGEFEGLLL
ncbi:thiamine pyrophosphate-binding protein [Teredinibacter waterburyi]|uniref:thiamine pyrophosphate-binding protein n=1 Tax=Teredinibacter waterburyi TaxID=1500538 RepID=UPI001FE50DBE|nr:thiamine pyrophosphate-binding protein [Teredinibacter waterburyi]